MAGTSSTSTPGQPVPERLVQTYGDGLFDETIWLLAPDATYDDCYLHAQAAERAEVLTEL
ncbi:hypothetical protein [Streptomyces carpinensis]|uniref:Uncharacterized protein n=1 Tax=Streptomyces carpinensis TaxID=66369 RepID=A0ABV1W4P2_9ACTN|nr:hypothetical protein [Streptomyces carpinensis]